LNRSELGCGESLDGYHVLPDHAAQWQQAGSYGTVADAVFLKDAEENGAGPAIAFATAFFGPREPTNAPEVVEDYHPGREFLSNFFVVEEKTNAGFPFHWRTRFLLLLDPTAS
jgi:hypothetical protein